jgi:myo-inositol-1(or 4)-monophosphatase
LTDQTAEKALLIAKQMACAAGRKVLECREHVTGKLKGFRDYVSEADLEAEAVIVDTIRSTFPDHRIMSEEGGGTDKSTSDYCWFVDPLDGTKNYLWGIPMSSVSIALAYQGTVCIGVVYDLWRDELFWGRSGHGVYLNEQRVAVAKHTKLSESMLGTDYGYTPDRLGPTAALPRSLQKEVAGLRAMGTAALQLAYVACGRFDGYFTYTASSWDVAAGGFLVSEAGGQTTDLAGGSNYLETGCCLATNGCIHEDILRIWKRDKVLDSLALS